MADTQRGYHKRQTRGFKHQGGGTTAGFRETVDIEDAAHAINNINKRVRREKKEQAETERKKVTLPGGDALATWLKKD